MADAAGQNFISQHGIDNGTFAVRCTSEKCNFHVITRQNLSDVGNFEDIAAEGFVLRFVDDIALTLALGELCVKEK